ncbi:MAG: hypothetical protein VSS75_020195 [Candidatus Parabeggiatoa sp.]|nr:hypothetical protein [Candidatus Parabeggiatoa sp.]
MINFLDSGYMNINNLIQYAIIFLIALLLIKFHDFLIGTNEENPFKHSVIDLSFNERWGVYLVLFIGTMVLMFLIASSLPFKLGGVIAIIVASISSFFIISSLNVLLAEMKEDKLSFKRLINQDFLWTIYLIIFTELSFLNFAAETLTYTKKPFLFFVLLYSLIIILVGIFLGIPKEGERKKIPESWKLKSIIILDPIIVILLADILAIIILSVIITIQ